MDIKINIANKSNYGDIRGLEEIKYIVIHATSNDGDSDEGNTEFFRRNIRGASAHYFVDDDSITRSVPDNYVAYSVGGKKYNDCNITNGGTLYGKVLNQNSISIEMCDTVKDGKFNISEKTFKNTVDLTKDLMEKYNITTDNVVTHFMVNGKHCPIQWFDSPSEFKRFKLALIKQKTIIKVVSKPQIVPSVKTIKNIISTKTTKIKSKISSNPDFIKRLQIALNSDGFRDYKERKLKIDGKYGYCTLSACPTLKYGSRGNTVKTLQLRLKELELYNGDIDGVWGKQMDIAVSLFQKNVVKISPDKIFSRNGKSWKTIINYK